MCVCDTQVEAGQRISTEYVTGVVSNGTGHSGILTRMLPTAVDIVIAVFWTGDICRLTSVGVNTVNATFFALWASESC